jgi:hypothetical protein
VTAASIRKICRQLALSTTTDDGHLGLPIEVLRVLAPCYISLMDANSLHDDFTPQEAQRRFRATLLGALKMPPQYKDAFKMPVAQIKKRSPYARASSASVGTGRRQTGRLPQ